MPELRNVHYVPPGEVDPDSVDPDEWAARVSAQDTVRERFRSLFSAFPGSTATGPQTALVRAFNPDEERDDHGRWTAGGGSDAASEKDLAAGIKERWGSMSADEKAQAGNVGAVDAQMGRFLGGLRSGEPSLREVEREPSPDSYAQVRDNAQEVLDSFKDALPSDSYRMLQGELQETMRGLEQAGFPVSGNMQDLDKYMQHTVEALVYQEARGWERQLGDHGAHHIVGDARLTTDILHAVGGASKEDEALVRQTALYHDMGYTADAARLTIEGTGEHPDYGAKYLAANQGMFDRVFGKDGTARMQDLITEHQGSGVDWQHDPVGSSLRVADNMALFAAEKMPPIIRYTPEGTSLLKSMASDPAHFEDYRQRFKDNIQGSRLSAQMKAGLTKAADELFPLSPKFTLGMFAGKLGKVSFDGHTLDVPVRFNQSAYDLEKYFNVGQRQFQKFGESYGLSKADTERGDFVARNAQGRAIMHVHVEGAPAGLFKRVWDSEDGEWTIVRVFSAEEAAAVEFNPDIERLYNPDEERDEHGRWTAGGGSAVTSNEHRDEPRQIALVKQTGGFTYTPLARSFVQIGEEGYGVSPYPERETIISDRSVSKADLHTFVQKNADLLAKPGHYAGAWFDPESKRTYLDVSVVTKSEPEARSLSERYKQEAYFTYKSGETVYVHARTGEVTRGGRQLIGLD